GVGRVLDGRAAPRAQVGQRRRAQGRLDLAPARGAGAGVGEALRVLERALILLAERAAKRVGHRRGLVAAPPRALEVRARLSPAPEREVSASERVVPGPLGDAAHALHPPGELLEPPPHEGY